MSNRELKNLLGAVRHERRGGMPHDVWVARNREILLMQIRNTTDSAVKKSFAVQATELAGILFPVEQLAVAARGLGVFMLVVGTLFGGGLVSAQAFRTATPGQPAYSVKLAVERAQVFLAPNEDYRARLHTEFADRRADEIAGLAEGSSVSVRHVAAALESFRNEVEAMSVGLERLKVSDPSGVIETAKLTERKMAVYQEVLRKAAGSLPLNLRGSLRQTRQLVDGVALAAMFVIVEKHLAGDVGAPKAIVEVKFADSVKQAEAKLSTTGSERAVQAKAALAAAKEMIEESNYQAALSKMVEVVELTAEDEDATAAADEAAQAEQTKEETPTTEDSTNAAGQTPEATVGSGSR